MDAVMPGLNGFETCRRMKRNKMFGGLPVIFMTGLTETENVLEGLAAGGVDYVTKPLVVDELLARIRVHLANARVAAGTRAALDATGRFLLATNASGRLLWCTPKARQLLAELFPSANDHNASLPATMMGQLMQLRSEGGNTRLLVDVNGRKVEISVLSPIGPDELLFRPHRVVHHGRRAAAAADSVPDIARVGGTVVDQPRQGEPRNRRDPRHQPADREQAPRTDIREARRREPRLGGSACGESTGPVTLKA
jgi:hypothetical protein